MADTELQGHANPAFDPSNSDIDTRIGAEKPVKSHNNDQVVYENSDEMVVVEKQPPGGESAAGEAEIEVRKQARRDCRPLWICKAITSKPKLFFALTLVGHLLMLVITAILVRIGYDILPITFDRIPLDILDDPDFLRGLAWANRNEQEGVIVERGSAQDTGVGVQAERSQMGEFIEMYFETSSPDGNVFTKDNLLTIQRVENDFFQDVTFQEEYCQLDGAGDCVKARSILRFFDGTYASKSPIFNDPNFDNVPGVLWEAYRNNETRRQLLYHLGNSAVVNDRSAVSYITRLFLTLGRPLKGYSNVTDRSDDQKSAIDAFMKESFAPKADGYFADGAGDLNFFYNSISLLVATITSQVFKDLALAIGSLCFIIVFMFIQTGSLWVSLWANFSIVTGFCCANLIYRVILDYRYFGTFHVLAVFIILGIGADDVFVFFDNWKETSHHKYPSLAHRLSDCYRKASLAMFFTSITTAVAFIVSGTSPFLGISSFGVFAGVLVFVNYISVIVFFPAVVVTYHLYFERYCCCCCCPRADGSIDDVNSPPPSPNRKHPIVRFFRGPYFRFVTHKVARWIILAVFAVILAVFIYFATTLEVNEEQVKFLKDDTNFGKYLARRDAFSSATSDRTIQVMLVWGLKEQDLSACHHTDPSCQGDLVWDDKFDINADGVQQALLDLCATIKGLPNEELSAMAIRKDNITSKPEVLCFLKDLDDYYRTKSAGAVTVPILTSEADSIMASTPYMNKTKLGDGFDKHFEIALSAWMYGQDRTVFSKYNSLLGEAALEPHTQVISMSLPGGRDFTITYGTQLKYAAIVINTTMESATLGFPTGLPIRNKWNSFLEKELEHMPPALKGGFPCTPATGSITINIWHWLRVQETLTSSALIGVGIGIALAFPILVLAAHNILVGLLATLTIGCIVGSVFGLIPMVGWKLGLLESLNLVLVVGLSVDYVVHLAEGYSRSVHEDRLGRTRDALEEVGISVLSGATTTMGASLFLLFAEILFFTQFGTFMFCTIAFSIVYALGLFITVIALFGPQGDTGSLKPLYRWCGRKCGREPQAQPQSL